MFDVVDERVLKFDDRAEGLDALLGQHDPTSRILLADDHSSPNKNELRLAFEIQN